MQALEGIVVLDLGRRYPAAYTSRFLADFGATVIKVDPPGAVFPLPGIDSKGERFPAFFAPDRNKKSMVLNLRCDEGREVFRKLAAKADVLIEGFRPGVMAKLGVDYESLEKANPRLIYCALSGYGQDGPYAKLPGHDMNYIAVAGALSQIGPKDGPPCFPSNYLADMAGAGLHGVIGILLALAAREKTGLGQFIDVAYLDGVISLLTIDSSLYFLMGKIPRRGETALTGGAPWAQVLMCKDGEYITIGCAEPRFWENLCRAIGRDDLIPFHNPPEEKKGWVVAELQKVFLTRTRDEWWDYLKQKDTCVGPVNNFTEAFADPQVRHRQMVLEFDHPRLGKVKQTGIPIKLSRTPGSVRSLGAPIGAHTDEVLSSLGYAAPEIRKLRAGGVVE